MIDENAVLKEFESLSGLSPSDCAKHSSACHICCVNLFERLKIPEYERDGRIISLAAAMLFYKFSLCASCEEDNVISIKSGDISVTKDNLSLISKAGYIKDEAESFAAPLLTDNNFMFCGV